MGAYYEATIGDTRYDTHSLDNGLKLMEHSYLENNYCISIEYLLLNEPQSLVWLCDYHESNEDTLLTWENTSEENAESAPIAYSEHIKIVYIVNHSKGIYFEKSKLLELIKKEKGEEEWGIHPLPILCNSDRNAQGGGDYRIDDSRRGTWCSDDIGVYTSRESFPEDFEDITEDVIFFEN